MARVFSSFIGDPTVVLFVFSFREYNIECLRVKGAYLNKKVIMRLYRPNQFFSLILQNLHYRRQSSLKI